MRRSRSATAQEMLTHSYNNKKDNAGKKASCTLLLQLTKVFFHYDFLQYVDRVRDVDYLVIDSCVLKREY